MVQTGDAAEPPVGTNSVIPLQPVRFDRSVEEDSIHFRADLQPRLGAGTVAVDVIAARGGSWEDDSQDSVASIRIGLAMALTAEVADPDPGAADEPAGDEPPPGEGDLDIDLDITQWRMPTRDPLVQASLLLVVDPPIREGGRHRYRVKEVGGALVASWAYIEVLDGRAALIAPNGDRHPASSGRSTPWMKARRFTVEGLVTPSFYRFYGRFDRV